MTALPAVGSLVFLLVAGVIAGYYRLRELDAEPVVRRFAPAPVDSAIAEDELVAELDDLYYAPAYGEAS